MQIVVGHTQDFSVQTSKEEEFQGISNYPAVYNEYQRSLGYLVRPYLLKK